MAVDGDIINYHGYCGTPTVDLLIYKLLFNSVISRTNEKFMTLDIEKFYLNTSLAIYKYICTKVTYI